MVEAVELRPFALPSVIYDKSLNEKNIPYKVEIDAVLCSKVLEHLNVDEKDIDSISIIAKRYRNIMSLGNSGVCKIDSRKVIIFTQRVWGLYKKWMSKTNKVISKREIANDDLFRNGIITPELESLLNVNPLQRDPVNTRDLLSLAMQRRLNQTLLHELHHAAMFTRRLKSQFNLRELQFNANQFAKSAMELFPLAVNIEPKIR